MSQTTLNNGATYGVQRAAINANFTELYAAMFAAPVLISTDVTINSGNQATYSGKTLEFTGAYTITLAVGISSSFNFVAIPPATGVATIASDGTSLINGSTIDVVRDFDTSPIFAVLPRASAANSYVVSGV